MLEAAALARGLCETRIAIAEPTRKRLAVFVTRLRAEEGVPKPTPGRAEARAVATNEASVSDKPIERRAEAFSGVRGTASAATPTARRARRTRPQHASWGAMLAAMHRERRA
jgi:hypothetical protein